MKKGSGKLAGRDLWARIHSAMADFDREGEPGEEELRQLWRRRATELARPAESVDESASWEKLVIMRVGKERYAFRVDDVEEIMRVPDVTPVPCVPPHFAGVINRRGSILPLVDLRMLFESSRTEPGRDGRIVVLCRARSHLGFLVDSADRIIGLPGGGIQPPLRRGEGAQEEYCEGIFTLDRRLVMLIDSKRLLQDAKMRVDRGA